MSTSSSEPESSFDPSTRRLCRDGSCTGLLGADDRCKLCGLLDADAPPFVLGAAHTHGGDEDESSDDEGGALDAAALIDPIEDGPGFDPGRRLCPDDACVGVIAADGRCPVCGQIGAG